MLQLRRPTPDRATQELARRLREADRALAHKPRPKPDPKPQTNPPVWQPQDCV